MKTTAVISTLTLVLILATATSAGAQKTSRPNRRSIDRVEQAKFLHINGSKGIFEIAIATKLPRAVTRSGRKNLYQIVRNLKAGSTKDAERNWSLFVSNLNTDGASADIHTILNWVLRQSYVEGTSDLQAQAEKVRFCNEQKKAIRKYIGEVRDYRTSLKEYLRTFEVQEYAKGNSPWRYGAKKKIPKSEVDRYLAEAEEYYSTASGRQQAANKDLLAALKRDQRTNKSISRTSKSMHDAILAILGETK